MDKLNYKPEEFLEAVNNSDYFFVEHCKHSKADLQFLFNIACKEGALTIVNTLIKLPEIDVNNTSGYALRWAVSNRHYNIVNLLIKNGATLTVDNNYCFKYLLSHKAPFKLIKVFIENVELKNCENEFRIALKNKDIQVIECFLDFGFRIPVSDVDLVIRFLGINNLNFIKRASENKWFDLKPLKNDINKGLSQGFDSNLSRLNSDVFKWVLKRIPSLLKRSKQIFSSAIWRNNIDLADFLFVNYLDKLASCELYLFNRISQNTVNYLLDNKVIESIQDIKIIFSGLFKNKDLTDNTILELVKRLHNSAIVIKGLSPLIVDCLNYNRHQVIKEIIECNLLGCTISHLPKPVLSWPIEIVAFLLDLKGLIEYPANKHIDLFRQIIGMKKENLDLIATRYNFSQIDIQLANLINHTFQNVLKVHEEMSYDYSRLNVKQVFEDLNAQIHKLNLNEETKLFERLTSDLSKSKLLSEIEDIWLNAYYDSGDPKTILDIFNHFEMDIEMIRESLFKLVLDCHFKSVMHILLNLDENCSEGYSKKYRIEEIFIESEYMNCSDLFIGLIHCGDKEIMELLYKLVPSSRFWVVYGLPIFSTSNFKNQYIDFLLNNIDESDDNYTKFLELKLNHSELNPKLTKALIKNKDYFTNFDIKDFKSVSDIEKTLRFSVKAQGKVYLKQILQSAIRVNNISLSVELAKCAKEKNMLDDNMLLEAPSPLLTKRLLDLNPDLTPTDSSYFLKAISKGNEILMEAYLTLGVNFRAKKDKGILLAAERGDLEIVKRLIGLGCDVTTANSIILSKTESLTLMNYLLNNHEFPQEAIEKAILHHCYYAEEGYNLIDQLTECLKSKKILELGFLLTLESQNYITARTLVNKGVDSKCFFGISKLYKQEFLKCKNSKSKNDLTGAWKNTYDQVFEYNYNMPLFLLKVVRKYLLARVGKIIFIPMY